MPHTSTKHSGTLQAGGCSPTAITSQVQQSVKISQSLSCSQVAPIGSPVVSLVVSPVVVVVSPPVSVVTALVVSPVVSLVVADTAVVSLVAGPVDVTGVIVVVVGSEAEVVTASVVAVVVVVVVSGDVSVPVFGPDDSVFATVVAVVVAVESPQAGSESRKIAARAPENHVWEAMGTPLPQPARPTRRRQRTAREPRGAVVLGRFRASTGPGWRGPLRRLTCAGDGALASGLTPPDNRRAMDKTYPSADAAVADLRDGITLMSGGFGLCGNPENLIQAIHRKGVRDIDLVSNNCGVDGVGLGILLEAGQVRSITASYVGENKTFEKLYLSGKLKVTLVPQGTLAERIRAGGAGIGGFYTPTGYGTPIAEGKEVREIDGRWYVLEAPLKADFAIVKAWKGDTHGNLVFRRTANNFNQAMATAAKVTIAEVEELVPAGALDPDHVHTPGIYVQRIILGERYAKPIEFRTVRSA